MTTTSAAAHVPAEATPAKRGRYHADGVGPQETVSLTTWSRQLASGGATHTAEFSLLPSSGTVGAVEANRLSYALVAAAYQMSKERGEEDETDYLKELYPHVRDHDCRMDEITHTYYVHEKKYPFSVSSVWKVFFPQFNATKAAIACLNKASDHGLRCFDTAVYNLMQHLLYVEKLDPSSPAGVERVARAVEGAQEWYDSNGVGPVPFTAEDIQAAMVALSARQSITKPSGPSCYFFSYCLGVTEAHVRQQWKTNGGLESFKGTFLHKQAELYMQSLAKSQLLSGRSHVPLRVLLAEQGTAQEAWDAAAPVRVVRLLAPRCSVEVWDHPSTQAFLAAQLRSERSIEFQKFEAWLRSRLELTPFRSEWSIYDEEEQLAGQIDSLWLDTENSNAIVMADWKRAKHRLESEPAAQRRQVFNNERGLDCCAFSALPGPCAEMYNCAYNHYSAQQNLYAHFLDRHYDLHVSRIFLVQCHPDVGATSADFCEAVVPYEAAFARDMVEAFRDGWQELLNSSEDK